MKSPLPAALLAATLLAPASFAQEALETRAERTDYGETSSNADVLAFARELAARSNEVRLTYIGKSAGGNRLPLLILGRPAPASPVEMIGDGRLCVFILANIHAGEVEGKEASLMLARDILLGDRSPLLDKLVILIAPNYNPDGNDRISPENRSYQGGPEGGVGVRPNGGNLDLNRDWMKLESPEARAVVQQVLNRWDPALVVDCHTTNGSPHREPLTYSPPFNPSGNAGVRRYASDVLIPQAAGRLLREFGYASIPYGNFVDRLNPAKGWSTFGHRPRYTTNYAGLRNRLAVLIETYAFAKFRIRVLATYGFLESLLHHCAADARKIAGLIREADRLACARARGLDPQRDRLVTEVELKPLPEPLEILGYKMEAYTDERGRQRVRPTEKEVTYTVPNFADFTPKRSIPIPAAYLIPAGAADIADKLRQHGIAVERLTRETELRVQIFKITELKSGDSIYQGHRFTRVSGEWDEELVSYPAGTFAVRTAQPLGALAAYLLEPESDDGLLLWNFFDRYLTRQWGGGMGTYPVSRVFEVEPLPLELTAP